METTFAARLPPPPIDAMSGQAEMEGPIITFEEMESFLHRECHRLQLDCETVRRKIAVLNTELKAKMPKPNHRAIFPTPNVPGFSGNSRAVETVTKELTNLELQYTQLGEKLREIHNQTDDVMTLRYKQEEISWLIPEIIVIAFVNHLEKADQYFDFKDYLRIKHDIKLDSSCVHVADMLFMNEEVRKLFDKLDKEFIERAVDVIMREKHANDARSHRAEYIKYVKALNIERRKNGEYPLEQVYEQMASICGTLNSNDPEEMYRASDPISNLVYYTREKVYVMDEEPKMELQKLHVQYKVLRAALKRIMSTYKDKPHEDVLSAIRTELYGEALERYHAFRKKYTKEHTEGAEKPAKDELMPDNNRKSFTE